MTDADRAHFRQRLQDERAQIRASLALADPAQDSITPDDAIGRLTRMEALQAQAMSDATRARQQKRLKQIDAALQRIEDGSYGTCLRCGKPVETGRLEIMPETRLCIACARG